VGPLREPVSTSISRGAVRRRGETRLRREDA
jgi:hypothetical protein